MGLITKKVLIGMAGKNIKRYESLGYFIPRKKDKNGKLSVTQKTEIEINVCDISNGSGIRVDCECDNCGIIIKNIRWVDYQKTKKEDGKTYCNICSVKLYGTTNMQKSKLDRGISFLKYCIEKNNELGIKLWSNKNKKSPSEYSYGCKSVVYWKCENGIHDDYERTIKNSLGFNFRCPFCVQEKEESFLQEKIRNYLEYLFDIENIKHENRCELICINPRTNKKLLYDNEIITNNFKLIIETHGEQHYKISNWHKLSAKQNNTTPKYEFEYQQWKDEYKKQFALDNGYYYLAVSYLTDDSQESYKSMINNIIDYINK